MRVLQFGRFWNEQHGGVERHVSQLSAGLASHGVDVVNLVAAAGLRGSDAALDGYRLVQAPSFGKAFSTALAPALLSRALALHRQQPFHVFHLHFPDPLTHLASMVLPRDVPRVITWHSDIIRQKRLLALYKPWQQREILRASAIVAATQAHFDSSTQIPASFARSKLHVIPYGMDYGNLKLDSASNLLRDRLRAQAQTQAPGKRIIFTLGRHVSYKGFDVLIRAMQYCDGYLMIGGDGPLRAALEAQAVALGLQERIHFTERIPEEDLAAYFHACDVFCLPSVTQMEAFGLVQLEAMVCGKPVVCTRLRNGVNVVNVEGVTGLAAEPGDDVELGACLQRILDDSTLRETLGAQGQAWALEQYSLDAMVRRHVALYDGLVQPLAAASAAS